MINCIIVSLILNQLFSSSLKGRFNECVFHNNLKPYFPQTERNCSLLTFDKVITFITESRNKHKMLTSLFIHAFIAMYAGMIKSLLLFS